MQEKMQAMVQVVIPDALLPCGPLVVGGLWGWGC